MWGTDDQDAVPLIQQVSFLQVGFTNCAVFLTKAWVCCEMGSYTVAV